jgi:hypothetical protein
MFLYLAGQEKGAPEPLLGDGHAVGGQGPGASGRGRGLV